jgi:excisionase family DNA binding protein
MDAHQTIVKDQQRRTQQRAMSIAEFCERYGTGRTTTYQEIKMGRLRARKCGKRTIISEDDAEEWLRRLPLLETELVS